MINSRISCSFTGKSRLRVIVALGLIILAGIAVFYKLRQDTMKSLVDSKRARIQALDDRTMADVRALLENCHVEIDKKLPALASKSLRKASLIDVKGDFAAEIQQLKLLIVNLEHEIARVIAIDDLVSRVRIEMEAGRLEMARNFISEDGAIHLTSPQISDLSDDLESLIAKRDHQKRLIVSIRQNLLSWQLESARLILEKLEPNDSTHNELDEVRTLYGEKMDANSVVLQKISELESLDNGTYSVTANKLLTHALLATPTHPELLKLQKKFAEYPQVVKVPADYASIEEALVILKNGGTILLGEGTFFLRSEIKQSVNIKGDGSDVTLIESSSSNFSGISFNHPDKVSTISNVSFVGDVESSSQDSLLHLQAGGLKLLKCEIKHSSAHGIAISDGDLELIDSVVRGNLWCGIALQGAKSSILVRNSTMSANGKHGLSIWNGAQAKAINSSFNNNAQTGVVLTGAGTSALLSNSASSQNRQSGVYVADGAALIVSEFKVSSNLFSGVVMKSKASVLCSTVELTKNGEYGYIVDPSVKLTGATEITGEGNTLGRVLRRRFK